MRYAGLLMIALCGLGAGLYSSRCLYRRADCLRQMERILSAFLQRLQYTAEPLPDLWKHLTQTEPLNRTAFIKALERNMRTQELWQAWNAAVDSLRQSGTLTAEDCGLLLEFGAGCGITDMDGQIAHVRTYREQLSCFREQAEQQAQLKGRVRLTMGVAGGIGLALLLL